MEIKDLSVHFTETATEEMALLVQEAGVIPLVDYLVKHNERVPEELKNLLVRLVGVVSDLFSSELPSVSDNPEETLRSISREINLARVLRERGMFRMYRLLRQRTDDGVLMYMTLRNPDTGGTFTRQEDFISWFCASAGVSRSLLFQRISTIEKMEALHFTLDESFHNILSKPYAMRELLNTVATWKDGDLYQIEPEVALQVARRVSPDSVPELEALAEAAEKDPQAVREFHNAVKPVLAQLVSEVAGHERAVDALAFVRYDVLLQPEISYRWEDDVLYVELVQNTVDTDSGDTVALRPIVVPFIPDTTSLPDAIRQDLLRRLPIKNRFTLDE